MNKPPKVKYRGVIYPKEILPKIKAYDYSFLKKLKAGFLFSYEIENFQFHAVDRFATFPLFYCVKNGIPYVSEKVEELLPYINDLKLDPVGFLTKGNILGLERTKHTPFQGIERLMPGHYLEFKEGKISINKYWSFLDLKGTTYTGTYEEAVEELSKLVRQAVNRCYQFAPNAALHLSGGFDSGTIATIIGQTSKEERHTYSRHNVEHSNEKNNDDEKSFIKKYQNRFPQLVSHSFKPTPSTIHSSFPDPDNWLFISHDDNECKIAADVKKRGIKYIFTGLGGDELSTYSNVNYNGRFRINNDWQAKLYTNWIIHKKSYWSRLIRTALSGRIPKDLILLDKIHKKMNNHSFWYTSQFKNSAKEVFEYPTIWLNSFPASQNYRLEILKRSYFTIRSDKWNFIGRRFGIDYLHPLLDADLVDFCASLPIDFYVNRPHRDLIKKALKNQIPQELLQGTKRPIYFNSQSIDANRVSSDIQSIQKKIEGLRNTFAETVYNLNNINSFLAELAKIMKVAKNSPQSKLGILFSLGTIEEIIRGGQYLNSFFGK